MATMNISMPDSLKSFVDEQVEGRGYGTSSEYVRHLIRQEVEHERFRKLVREGMESPLAGPADDQYFEGLQNRIRSAKP